MISFDPAVRRWLSALGSVRDAVRQELVARQIAEHLAAPPLRVVDIGCGQGTQAIRLAAAGHEVTGVDTSAELLDRAQHDAALALGDAAGRLQLHRADLFGFARDHPQEWDVVCCHGVVMYLPSLDETVQALAALARPGGLISLLTRNQAGIAMRSGLAGRWAQAVRDFDATRYTNNLGLAGVRADPPALVRTALAASGAPTIAWYGVRLFSDQLSADVAVDDVPAEDFAALLAAEAEAGRRDPYRQLAALTHTLARRKAQLPG